MFFILICFWSLLTLSLSSKMAFNKFLCCSSASLILMLHLKILSQKDLIVGTFLKLYWYLLDFYIKSFLLICSSNPLIWFNLFWASCFLNLLEKYLQLTLVVVDAPVILKFLSFDLFFSLIFNCFYLFLKTFIVR